VRARQTPNVQQAHGQILLREYAARCGALHAGASSWEPALLVAPGWPAAERIGNSNGMSAPASRARTSRGPQRPPPAATLPTSLHAPPARPGNTRRSAPAPGGEPPRAAWTGRAGWGRVAPHGVPWGESLGKDGCGRRRGEGHSCSPLMDAASSGATLWAYWRDTGALPA
jgi:hypothetical protein